MVRAGGQRRRAAIGMGNRVLMLEPPLIGDLDRGLRGHLWGDAGRGTEAAEP